MMESEKDTLLDKALEIIVTERVEMGIINADSLGYIGLLQRTVIQTSLTTFLSGVEKFYKEMEGLEHVNEINSLHSRFMMRCINSEYILSAANQLYTTVKENLTNDYQAINYDLIENNTFANLTNVEKILLLFHIYEDRIEIPLANIAKKMVGGSEGGKK